MIAAPHARMVATAAAVDTSCENTVAPAGESHPTVAPTNARAPENSANAAVAIESVRETRRGSV